MQKEWSYKEKIILIVGSLIITASVFLGIKYLFPIMAPFLVAFLIALMIERYVKRLSKVFGGRKVLAASVIMVVLTTVIILLLGYVAYLGIQEIKSFITNYDYYVFVARQSTAKICYNFDHLLGLSEGCSEKFVIDGVNTIQSRLSDNSSGAVSRMVSVSLPVAVNAIKIVGSIVISLMSVVYISNVLDKIRTWCKTTVFRKEVAVVKDSLKKLMNVYFRVQGLIMVINSCVCVGGLMIIKNPYSIVIGILIGILDALPIFGTGTVLLPWALVMVFMKEFFVAAVLFSVYLITYFVREIMESKCMGERLGIAPFTMLIVIFTGLMVYGIMGFILGPISYCIIKALIHYLKTVIERGKLNYYDKKGV